MPLKVAQQVVEGAFEPCFVSEAGQSDSDMSPITVCPTNATPESVSGSMSLRVRSPVRRSLSPGASRSVVVEGFRPRLRFRKNH